VIVKTPCENKPRCPRPAQGLASRPAQVRLAPALHERKIPARNLTFVVTPARAFSERQRHVNRRSAPALGCAFVPRRPPQEMSSKQKNLQKM